MRKRTTHDENGRKAREIPGTTDRMARIEQGKKKKKEYKRKIKPKENQKQAERTISTNSLVLQWVTSSQYRHKPFVLVLSPTTIPTSTDLYYFCIFSLILKF